MVHQLCCAHFDSRAFFFGVLCNLFGVLGRVTGVVLGAMFVFFGVPRRLGDCVVFVATGIEVLKTIKVNIIRSLVLNKLISYFDADG